MKIYKLLFVVSIVFIFCFNVKTSFAKEYYYKDFEVDIKINQDSTFDVTEKQTYFFDGNFGFVNRNVSLNKIDAITDIEVFDGDNNKIPKIQLFINLKNGAKYIQWNFARRDFDQEEKSWTVKYKVHGGISFLKNYDEIYWNAIPSVRDVAIQNVKVTISLENGEKFNKDLIWLYAEDIPSPIFQTTPILPLSERMDDWDINDGRNEALPLSYGAEFNPISSGGYYFNQDNTEAIFWGRNIRPNTNFTVAVGFPKGIVSQGSYFKDFLFMYYGYILSILIFISAVIYGFYHWYKTERSREGKRAIVPQYEPPQNLKPAMAEVIIKERLTNKGLTATIVDLAVRGYVRIEEVPELNSKVRERHLIKTFILFFLILPFAIILFLLLLFLSLYKEIFFFLSLILPVLLMLFTLLISLKRTEKRYVNYIIKKAKLYESASNLEDYERKYLDVLFDNKEYFSTEELKKDRVNARVLYEKILKIKDKIYKEVELDTKAFETGLTIEKKKTKLWKIFFFPFYIIYMLIGLNFGISQLLFLITTGIVSIGFLYAFIKYEARLSDKGIKLKEDWLGFKMYLETAEKYRMQNLKPEYFEKYLPYAMIFGVEKKWAKAFESMNVPRPSWYVGATNMASSFYSSAFSSSAFSASFASSFYSAISSSGASGASGGGGGAGGGAGGGGGGAG
ncbi:DUF2207 domain-containing protein [Patescibacteria group bacterium]|nr:DUF2207 domain-containing protein [Patescibacteria group bacterium]